jgi:hypothetical protein
VSGGIIELTAIVALDDFDGAVKLCGDISDFFDKVEKVSDLMCKGKSPNKMGVIIKDNQIIFVARYANNRRSPCITMY